VEFPGIDGIPFLEAGDLILSEIEEFLTGAPATQRFDRILATVPLTDIVNSAACAEMMGNRAWRDLLGAHDSAVRN